MNRIAFKKFGMEKSLSLGKYIVFGIFKHFKNSSLKNCAAINIYKFQRDYCDGIKESELYYSKLDNKETGFFDKLKTIFEKDIEFYPYGAVLPKHLSEKTSDAKYCDLIYKACNLL